MAAHSAEEMVTFVEQILEEAEKLSIEYPYAVYVPPIGSSACQYTRGVLQHDGKDIPGPCGCLIGQAILRVYPEAQSLLEHVDSIYTIEGVEAVMECVLRHKFSVDAKIEFLNVNTPGTGDDEDDDLLMRRLSALVDLLGAIQVAQDEGIAWRTCVLDVRNDNDLPPGMMLCQSYRVMLDQ